MKSVKKEGKLLKGKEIDKKKRRVTYTCWFCSGEQRLSTGYPLQPNKITASSPSEAAIKYVSRLSVICFGIYNIFVRHGKSSVTTITVRWKWAREFTARRSK